MNEATARPDQIAQAFKAPSYLPAVTIDRGPAMVAGAMLAAGFLAIASLVDLRQAALYLVGGLLGVALYHGSFGFTGGWRRFAVERRGRAIRAQMLMIGVAAVATRSPPAASYWRQPPSRIETSSWPRYLKVQ